MAVTLTIPDSIAEAIRFPASRMEEDLLTELAVALYADGALSLGKARQLAGREKLEFGCLLTRRGIPRHYGEAELQEDLAYGRRQ